MLSYVENALNRFVITGWYSTTCTGKSMKQIFAQMPTRNTALGSIELEKALPRKSVYIPHLTYCINRQTHLSWAHSSNYTWHRETSFGTSLLTQQLQLFKCCHGYNTKRIALSVILVVIVQKIIVQLFLLFQI